MQDESIAQEIAPDKPVGFLRFGRLVFTPLVSVVFVLAIAGFGLSEIAETLRSDKSAYVSAAVAGNVIGLGIGSLFWMFIAWLVYRVSGRKQVAGNWTLGIVSVLLMLGTLLPALGKPRMSRADKALLDSQMQATREAMASNDDPQKAFAEAQRLVGSLREVSSRVDGDSQKLLQSLSRVIERNAAASESYQKIVAKVNEAEIAMKMEGTPESCEAYQEAARTAKRASQEMRRYITQVPGQLKAELLKEGLSEEVIERELNTSDLSQRMAALDRWAEIEGEVLDLCIARGEVLRTSTDKWSFSVGTGVIEIDDDATFDRYLALCRQAELAGEESLRCLRVANGLPASDPNAKPAVNAQTQAVADQVTASAEQPSLQAARTQSEEEREALRIEVLVAAAVRATEASERLEAVSSRLEKYDSFYTFTREAQFKAYLSVFDQYVSAQRAVRDTTKDLNTALRKGMLEAGFSEAEAIEAADEISPPSLLPAKLANYDAMIAYSVMIADEAKHLSGRIGQWVLNKKTNEARFADAKKQTEYQTILKKQRKALVAHEQAIAKLQSAWNAWEMNQSQEEQKTLPTSNKTIEGEKGPGF